MSTTVTKLKAVISNNDLPILLSDGTMTDYYTNGLIEKCHALGYEVTATERAALEKFVTSAKEHGYIDHIYCFYPFIGNKTTPKAGTVPHITKDSDWDASSSRSVDYTGAFQYGADGHILTFGKVAEDQDYNYYITSSYSYDEVDFELGFFANFGRFTSDYSDFTGLAMISAGGSDTDNTCEYYLQPSYQGEPYMRIRHRIYEDGYTHGYNENVPYPTAEQMSAIVDASLEDTEYNASLMVEFTKVGTTFRRKIYLASSDGDIYKYSETAPSNQESFEENPYASSRIRIGSNVRMSAQIPMNCFAIISYQITQNQLDYLHADIQELLEGLNKFQALETEE